MNRYTYENVIYNPKSEEANYCINKVVFYSDSPTACLYHANNKDSRHCGILQSIKVGDSFPFVVVNITEGTTNVTCNIIPLNEDDDEYIPFVSGFEFIREYEDSLRSYNDDGDTRTPMDAKLGILGGVWLKHEFSDCNGCEYFSVTEIRREGLVIGRENEVTSWDKVLETYQFLDGTPCGKVKDFNTVMKVREENNG